jgi:hypothetical protein
MYVPPLVKLETAADFDRWPTLGRIGFCQAGEDFGGMFLLIVREAPSWYSLQAFDPEQPRVDKADDIVADDEAILGLLKSNTVEWSPPELDDLVERRVAGVRGSYRRNLFRRNWTEAFRYDRWDRHPTEDERRRALIWPAES